MKIRYEHLICVLLFLLHKHLVAREIKPDSVVITKTITTSATIPPLVPRVTKLEIRPRTIIKDGRKNTNANHIVFGDSLYVFVENLDHLIRESEAIPDNPIVLYINGKRIEGVYPIFRSEAANPLVYLLERNEISNEAWNEIFRTTDIIKKRINVSVGVKIDRREDLVADGKLWIIFILRPIWTTIAVSLLIAGLLILTVFLIVKKELLCDDAIADKKPYSLARTQLFYWTAIILLSYVFIWYVTDDMNSIDGTSLILLGISAGTAAAAKVIDDSGRNSSGLFKTSSRKGFFYDILWDGKSISIHRYQNVLFNLVIGLFFIITVLENYKMPALSETVLVLMGISSATYAALKTTETKIEPMESQSSTTKNTPDIFVGKEEIPMG